MQQKWKSSNWSHLGDVVEAGDIRVPLTMIAEDGNELLYACKASMLTTVPMDKSLIELDCLGHIIMLFGYAFLYIANLMWSGNIEKSCCC